VVYSSERAQCFGRTYRLHRQGELIAAAFCSFLVWFTRESRRCIRHVPPKRQAPSELHDITTQRVVLTTVTAVRTSRPLHEASHFAVSSSVLLHPRRRSEDCSRQRLTVQIFTSVRVACETRSYFNYTKSAMICNVWTEA
jgi:hypothetical protein